MPALTIDQAMEIALEHHRAGRCADAEFLYRRILAHQPRHHPAMHFLGILAGQAGRHDEAVEWFRQSIVLHSSDPTYHVNLSKALREIGQREESIAACRTALRLHPNFAEAHNHLGNALVDSGRLVEAIAAFREAIRLQPNFAPAHGNLGGALKTRGDLVEAIACFRKALRLRPDFADAHCNLVLSLNYSCSDPQLLLDEARHWARRHADPLRPFWSPHHNTRDPHRPLRIGYVSPDFRHHPVGLNLLGLFREFDRSHFECFCYSNVSSPDALTQYFREHADAWRDITKLSDAAAADLVRRDQIDILVDLALHTNRNRLLLFARRPAPVQITFAGYPGTTGLDAIDYRLTDPHLDPPGRHDAHYVEKSLHLSDTFWCCDPQANDIPVNPLPALSCDTITFGCLNNCCKLNGQIIMLWAKILRSVENSRLLLLAPHGGIAESLRRHLDSEGIAPRVQFLDEKPRCEYLHYYQQIDIGLDTLPYNGHTTSLDSFFMGVPVVTLVGSTSVGRAGLSQLMNLGFPELIAHTSEDYGRIAAQLAADLPRLAALRAALRPRMAASPLMNAPRFARNIHAACRHVWQKWCSEGGNA